MLLSLPLLLLLVYRGLFGGYYFVYSPRQDCAGLSNRMGYSQTLTKAGQYRGALTSGCATSITLEDSGEVFFLFLSSPLRGRTAQAVYCVCIV